MKVIKTMRQFTLLKRRFMPLIFSFILSVMSLAQGQYSEQPLRESATDLRSQILLFSLEHLEDEKTFILERTAGEDYFLRLKAKGEEIVHKISGREALRLDRDFSSRFLRCQYEIPVSEGNCEVTLRLMMKGERQDICKKDDKRSQEVTPILNELSKRFSFKTF